MGCGASSQKAIKPVEATLPEEKIEKHGDKGAPAKLQGNSAKQMSAFRGNGIAAQASSRGLLAGLSMNRGHATEEGPPQFGGELHGLIESSPLPWCIIDASGTIRHTNEMFRMQVGAGQDLFQGHPLYDFVFESYRVQTKKRFAALMKAKKDFKLQTVFRSKLPDLDLVGESEAVRKVLQDTIKDSVSVRVDLLFIPVSSAASVQYWMANVISVSLMNALQKEGDEEAFFQAKDDDALTKKQRATTGAGQPVPANLPGYLRPGAAQPEAAQPGTPGAAAAGGAPAAQAPQTLENRLDQAIATNEMQEATQKSRARRERRRSSMVAEPWDQRCKKWLLNMQTILALPTDSEVATTAKLWAGILLQASVDPAGVALSSTAVYTAAPGAAKPFVNKPMRRGSL